MRPRWGRKRAQGISPLPLLAAASRRRRRGASGCQAQSWSVRRPADSKHRSSGFRARYRLINTHAYTYALTRVHPDTRTPCTYHTRARARARASVRPSVISRAGRRTRVYRDAGEQWCRTHIVHTYTPRTTHLVSGRTRYARTRASLPAARVGYAAGRSRRTIRSRAVIEVA